MWLEVNNVDEIIYHLENGEALPDVDMIDAVVIQAEDLTSILFSLMSIVNKRLRVTLETPVPFNVLTPIIKKYIDEYYNVNTCEHKVKTEVFNDVFDE